MFKIDQWVADLYRNNYREVIDITVKTKDSAFHITESDIVAGSLKIDRFSVTGDKIEVGSAALSELKFTLDNYTGKYDDVHFEGARLDVKIGISKWDAHDWEKEYVHWIPCGAYWVDTLPRTKDTIDIAALDAMVLMDKPVDWELFNFPTYPEELVIKACAQCGVTLVTDLSKFPNHKYAIKEMPTSADNVTYRGLLQWCCQIMGVCAQTDYDGNLRMGWYSDTDVEITESIRYSSDLFENDVKVTGVAFTDGEDTYLCGDDYYAIDISGNPLVQDDFQSVVDNLGAKLIGFTYRPYETTVHNMPYIYPLDKITFVDKHGNRLSTIVTNVTYTMNSGTAISAKGKSAQENGYARTTLTAQESKILERMRRDFVSEMTEREKAVIEFNRLLSSSLGLRMIVDEKEDGTAFYYYCNGETLESSSIIYTFRANGFAWTKQWEGDKTVWDYGVTKEGNAVLNMISAYKLSADYITTGKLSDKTGKNFWDMDTGEFALAATAKIGGKTLDQTITEYDNSLDMKAVFNKLTNEGKVQGIFMKDGLLYINGSYVQTGKITDASGNTSWDLETGSLTSKKLSINSTNFTLDEDGNIKATGAELNNAKIVGGSLTITDASKNGLKLEGSKISSIAKGKDGGASIEVDDDGKIWFSEKIGRRNSFSGQFQYVKGVTPFTVNSGVSFTTRSVSVPSGIAGNLGYGSPTFEATHTNPTLLGGGVSPSIVNLQYLTGGSVLNGHFYGTTANQQVVTGVTYTSPSLSGGSFSGKVGGQFVTGTGTLTLLPGSPVNLVDKVVSTPQTTYSISTGVMVVEDGFTTQQT